MIHMYKALACSLPNGVVIKTSVGNLYVNFLCVLIGCDCLFLHLPRDVLKELLVLDGHVVKDKFINAYVEVTNSYQLLRCTCEGSFYF